MDNLRFTKRQNGRRGGELERERGGGREEEEVEEGRGVGRGGARRSFSPRREKVVVRWSPFRPTTPPPPFALLFSLVRGAGDTERKVQSEEKISSSQETLRKFDIARASPAAATAAPPLYNYSIFLGSLATRATSVPLSPRPSRDANLHLLLLFQARPGKRLVCRGSLHRCKTRNPICPTNV